MRSLQADATSKRVRRPKSGWTPASTRAAPCLRSSGVSKERRQQARVVKVSNVRRTWQGSVDVLETRSRGDLRGRSCWRRRSMRSKRRGPNDVRCNDVPSHLIRSIRRERPPLRGAEVGPSKEAQRSQVNRGESRRAEPQAQLERGGARKARPLGLMNCATAVPRDD
jgi:hypothetical protein